MSGIVSTIAGLLLIGYGIGLAVIKVAEWLKAWPDRTPRIVQIPKAQEPKDVDDMRFLVAMAARYRDAGRSDIATKTDELLGLFLKAETKPRELIA